MNKGIELTPIQIKAYEAGATMFLFPVKDDFFEIIYKKYNFPHDYHLLDYAPIKKGDKDIFIQEDFKIGHWNSETLQMAFDYRIGKCKELKNITDKIFDKLVNESIKKLTSLKIFPDSNLEYHWEKYNSPLDWYSASQMIKEQSRYSFSECIDIRVIRIQKIEPKCIIKANIVTKYELEEYGWELIKTRLNQQLKEQNVARTYEDNDYVFLVEFKR